MANIYLVQHCFNKSWGTCGFYEIVSAHSTKEKAIEKIEEINKSIESGLSFYFPNTKIKGEEYGGVGYGYTYEWYYNGGDKMFSHFSIIETNFE